jgi:hypothetical protein
MAHDRPATDQTDSMSICDARAEPLKKGANSICDGVRKDPVAEAEAVELVKGLPRVAAVDSHDVLLCTEVGLTAPHSAPVAKPVTRELLPPCCELRVVLWAVRLAPPAAGELSTSIWMLISMMSFDGR